MKKIFIAIVLLVSALCLVMANGSYVRSGAKKYKKPLYDARKEPLPKPKSFKDITEIVYPYEQLMYHHSGHPRKFCGPVQTLLLAPEGKLDGTLGRWVLKGKEPLLVKLMKNDPHLAFGLKNGFGIMLFVDDKLVMQNDFLANEDEGRNSAHYRLMEWTLDTTFYFDGQHYIYVNVCDRFDHWGIASLYIDIRNKEADK